MQTLRLLLGRPFTKGMPRCFCPGNCRIPAVKEGGWAAECVLFLILAFSFTSLRVNYNFSYVEFISHKIFLTCDAKNEVA
jgi:hypothetical protein